MLKYPKTNTLTDGLMERNLSMLDEIKSTIMNKGKEVIYRGKRSQTLREVKSVENLSKNL